MIVKARLAYVLVDVVLMSAIALTTHAAVLVNTGDNTFANMVVIDPSAMSISGIQTLAKKERAGRRVFILSVFENKDNAIPIVWGKWHSEITYKEAIAQLNAAQSR